MNAAIIYLVTVSDSLHKIQIVAPCNQGNLYAKQERNAIERSVRGKAGGVEVYGNACYSWLKGTKNRILGAWPMTRLCELLQTENLCLAAFPDGLFYHQAKPLDAFFYLFVVGV